MLRDVAGWWIGQLSDCVPGRWRAPSGAEGLIVTPVGSLAGGIEKISIHVRRNGKDSPLGEFDLLDRQLSARLSGVGKSATLQLPSGEVLAKSLTLPMAAERDLQQVLAFEMDRETPFSLDEVLWTYAITERDRQRRLLSVRLLLVPRAALEPLLQSLGDIGISLDRVEIVGGPDHGRGLPLAASERAARRWGGSRAARSVAAALCAILAVAAAAMPFVRQSLALASVDRQVASARAAADEALKLRRQVEQLASAGNLMAREREKAGRPLAILAAVTRALPDDTYLTEWQLQQKKVTIVGRSAAASRLIAALAAGAGLQNPRFSAPVMRIESANAEAFTITAESGP